MIEDLAETAREELKRADHSIYVSLKYTRTVDIIKNTLKRLISVLELAFTELCESLKQKKKIKEVPQLVKLRVDLVLKMLKQLKPHVDFYYLLKEIDKAPFDKKEEYRKNVALIAYVGNEKIIVDIEKLKEFYHLVVDFVNEAAGIVKK